MKRLLAEAQQLASSGKLEEAAATAAKAKAEAAKLANVPQGVNVSQEEARCSGEESDQAGYHHRGGRKSGGIDSARSFNEAIAKQMQEASQLVGLAQGKLLDENTKQLAIHGDLLKQLTTQMEKLVATQNGMLGKGGKAGETAEAASQTTGTTQGSQASSMITQAGTAGPIPSNLPSDLSPGVELNPEVRRAREEAQRRVELERGKV